MKKIIVLIIFLILISVLALEVTTFIKIMKVNKNLPNIEYMQRIK